MKLYKGVYYKYDDGGIEQKSLLKIDSEKRVKIEINSLEAQIYLRDILNDKNEVLEKALIKNRQIYSKSKLILGKPIYSNEPDGPIELIIRKNSKKSGGMYLYNCYYGRFVEDDLFDKLPKNNPIETTEYNKCECGKTKKNLYFRCYACNH